MAAGEMRSRASRRFWDFFRALPTPVQTLAVKNYQLWLRDQNHPSLHFHRLRGSPDRYSVRVGGSLQSAWPHGNGGHYLGLDRHP